MSDEQLRLLREARARGEPGAFPDVPNRMDFPQPESEAAQRARLNAGRKAAEEAARK